MTDLIYIGIAKLHRKDGFQVVSVSDKENEVKNDLEKFEAQGYRTEVQTAFGWFSGEFVQRTWRTYQKQLERDAAERFEI